MLKTKLLVSCIAVTLTPHIIHCSQKPPSRSATPLDERDWLAVVIDNEKPGSPDWSVVEAGAHATAAHPAAQAAPRAATPTPLPTMAAALILAPAAQQAPVVHPTPLPDRPAVQQQEGAMPALLQIFIEPAEERPLESTNNITPAATPLSADQPKIRKFTQAPHSGTAVLLRLPEPHEKRKQPLNWQLKCLNCLNCCKSPKGCAQIKCCKAQQCKCLPEKCVIL